ncbi:MAG TPA: exopolyphosphatase [Exilispira sp.]|nr:exopolyphosphatase [Exilispira sp.]HPB47913.1 exopolyphosphatase [Exilispira sp.]HQM88719.1 exopolyphosphatase [Exilispira sp.]HQQ19699.1 exopolyphosphatase [Exilispira sp.]
MGMRLITRSDFDGLACAILLKEAGIIDRFKFVHPKDIQDGLVEVNENDVLANVPYTPGAGLWFDHHMSEDERKAFPYNYKGLSKPAPSAAAVIYDYYDGETRFKKFKALMNAVNKSDSGNLSKKEILHPRGWILLSFIMDPRTSLGRYKDYRISNYQLMEKLVDYCRVLPINKILKLEDVKERIIRYKQQQKEYKKMIKKYSYMKNNVLIIDLRNAPIIYTGNRFIEYCLFPRANISIRVMWGKQNQNIVFAVGYSIINKTCKVNVGKLMLKYGGGGHEKVGTCQVQVQEADRTLQELIEACTEN